MHSRARVVAGVVAAAALITTAAPAVSQAASSKSPEAQVGRQLQLAQLDARRVTRAVQRDQAKQAVVALKRSRRRANAAARGARSLAAHAGDSQQAGATAVWTLAATAGTYGDAMQRFAGLVPDASSSMVQQSLASALPGTIAGREQIIALITQLVSQLTGQAQNIAAQALAALQAVAPGQAQQVAQVAMIGDLPASIASIIQQALATATSALNMGLSTLVSVAPQLPSGTQTQIGGALQTVTSAIQGLLPLLQQVIGVATGAATGAVSQATGLVQGLLGSLLGGGILGASTGTGSGTTPVTGGAGGLLGGGLIGGLIKLPLNLVSGLLGGLTGLLGTTAGH